MYTIINTGEVIRMKQLIINTLLFILLAYFMPGIVVNSVGGAFIAAILYMVLSWTLGTLLKIITLPLSLVTFGLFNFVINGIVLYVVDAIVGDVHFGSFISVIFIAILMSFVNSVLRDK